MTHPNSKIIAGARCLTFKDWAAVFLFLITITGQATAVYFALRMDIALAEEKIKSLDIQVKSEQKSIIQRIDRAENLTRKDIRELRTLLISVHYSNLRAKTGESK